MSRDDEQKRYDRILVFLQKKKLKSSFQGFFLLAEMCMVYEPEMKLYEVYSKIQERYPTLDKFKVERRVRTVIARSGLMDKYTIKSLLIECYVATKKEK